ncbi:MAG: LUD domain-containing protein [Chitinophagales bacterium]
MFTLKKHEDMVEFEEHDTQETQREILDAPTDKPMATRTVDFSHTEYVPMVPLTHTDEVTERTPIEATLPAADLDIQFATNLIEKGGKFVYCENLGEAVELVKQWSAENEWSHVFHWENEIKEAFNEFNFQRGVIGYTIENSDAAMCLCEALIAENGTVLLNPKQASRRRLPVFPKTQIFLADVSQLRSTLNKAILQFSSANRGELPSILDLTDNVKGHYYHDGSLVLKAEGPEDIVVILIDEKIPVSLKA